ncbi:MAG: glycosyltransferase family 2 protein [Acidobacteriota bacterium]
MQFVLFYLALITAILWLIFLVELAIGNRSIVFLKDINPLAAPTPPKVSVIIPACNEARNIREALQSVLHQDYPNIEFIVINDRSIDHTGEILNEMARSDSRLHVVHLRELPRGWLGKNHALYAGARQATGDILLFTDADIVMQPTTVARAVSYLQAQKLDNVTVLMEVRMQGFWLNIFTLAFSVFFSVYSRFWRAKNPRSAAHIGIGGFNMVYASVYRKIGGHQPIAMRPDDDMKLGKLIKQSGHRQELLLGKGMLSVEWYASVRELVRGLEKNAFSGVNYSLWLLGFSTLAVLLFNVFPFVAVFLTSGATRIVNLAAMIMILSVCLASAGLQNRPRWQAFCFPLATLLFLYIMWRSALLAVMRGGVDWRGTHYSLAELKANKI